MRKRCLRRSKSNKDDLIMGNLFNGVVAVVACALIPLVAVALYQIPKYVTHEVIHESAAI
jgi:hypothetical protein